MFTIWFPPRQRGLAMSVLHTAWPLTSLICYTTFVGLGSQFGWKLVIAGVNVFTLATIIIFFLLAPRDPEKAHDPEDAPEANPFKGVFRLPRQIWLASLSWFFFTSSMILMISFGASFLAQGGIDFGQANVAISFLMGAAGVITPFAGYIIDRFGSLKSYIVFPPFVVAVTFGLFVFRQEPALLLAMAGAAVAFTPTAIYAIPGMEVSPARVGWPLG
jgi:predicted MFS family arabinose efflux permease